VSVNMILHHQIQYRDNCLSYNIVLNPSFVKQLQYKETLKIPHCRTFHKLSRKIVERGKIDTTNNIVINTNKQTEQTKTKQIKQNKQTNKQTDNNNKSSNIHVIPIVFFRCQGRQFTQSQHPV
jgi:hypothetical protein